VLTRWPDTSRIRTRRVWHSDPRWATKSGTTGCYVHCVTWRWASCPVRGSCVQGLVRPDAGGVQSGKTGHVRSAQSSFGSSLDSTWCCLSRVWSTLQLFIRSVCQHVSDLVVGRQWLLSFERDTRQLRADRMQLPNASGHHTGRIRSVRRQPSEGS
jgi:hypothetical protein